jgi:hypothetical protein
MEYYDTLLTLVDTQVGKPLSSFIPLESLVISQLILALFALIGALQIFSFFTRKGVHGSKGGVGSAAGVSAKGSTKSKAKKFLLICGAPNSGKTALFYHFLTKEVRSTVSSVEVNQSQGAMEVKIPSQAAG